MGSPLKLQLTLKGRPMRDYTFIKDVVTIGRDPQADIFLDNIGVSRNQAKITHSGDAWVIEDCRSANGTWVNGRKVESQRLVDRDELTIGKFLLKVGLAAETKILPGPSAAQRAPAFDGTTVLTKGQLASILEMTRESQADPVELLQMATAMPHERKRPWYRSWLFLAVAFSAAVSLGAALTALFMK